VSNLLLTPPETAAKIAAGKTLLLAGEEKLLASLPPGNWIGGTIPYFMAAEGGCLCQDKIFVTECTFGTQATTKAYAKSELPAIYQDGGDGEISFVILPADSSVHTEFALNAPRYKTFAEHPLLGWISGVNLSELEKSTPKVFCGSPRPLADAAAVLRVKLPANQFVQIGIINLFEPGQGDTITFKQGGFAVTTASVNGKECNLAAYLAGIGADSRLPLVANYCGAMVNVSFKAVNQDNGRVEFYAPVVPNTEYKLAAPVADYVSAFEARLKTLAPGNIVFSCNCILNYLYSKLEGHRTGGIVGPITFGEIAYQLLNQTLVYVELEKAE
jgi:hypothetical protein